MSISCFCVRRKLVHWIRVDKIHKKRLLDKEPIEFDSSSAVKSLFTCLMLKSMLSTLSWFLLVLLGYLFNLLSFLGGGLTI